MHALAEKLAFIYPRVTQELYLKDCFEGKVEEEHGRVALELAELSVRNNRKLLAKTIASGVEVRKSWFFLVWPTKNFIDQTGFERTLSALQTKSCGTFAGQLKLFPFISVQFHSVRAI